MKRALLVGINEYQDRSIRALRYAELDATRLAAFFEDRCAFGSVKLLTGLNATYPQVEEVCGEMLESSGPEDVFVFFFAGHGEERSGQDHRLLLRDTTRKALALGIGGLPVQGIELLMPAACHKVVILDACRGGIDATRAGEGKPLGEIAARDIQAMAKKPARGTMRVVSSCHPGELAHELEELSAGVFTRSLIQAANQRLSTGKDVAIDTEFLGEIGHQARETLTKYGRADEQRPWFQGDPQRLVLVSGHGFPVSPPRTDRAPVSPQRVQVPAPVEGPERLILTPAPDSPVSPAAPGIDSRPPPAPASSPAIPGPGFLGKIWQALDQSPVPAATPVIVQGREPVQGPREQVFGPDASEMVLIPAGEFWMGSNDGPESERPSHRVSLDEFWIDKYEVTNARYRKFVQATGHPEPHSWGNARFSAPEQPVVGVSWEDAVAFCKWAGKRLPMEAEWEKAARGGLEGKKYPWGDEDPSGRATDASHDGPTAVGEHAPNGYGLYDMAGNVFEWCEDRFDADYYKRGLSRNPPGPGAGAPRVVRGGSWDANGIYVRCAYRGWRDPRERYGRIGFRCARSR